MAENQNSDKIRSLHRKRGTIKASITSFNKKLDDWRDHEENRDPDYLNVSLESLQKSFEKFDAIQEELEELDETNESEHRDAIQDSYDRAVARARKYVREFSSPSESSCSGSIVTPSPQMIPVKLPTISLPKFDGTFEGWASFFDLFSSLIDKNPELSPVTKLQYLRSSLTGKAAISIQELETTEDNYKIAIETLKGKFDCPRRAMRRHWSILRDFPKLQKDTPAALGQLADTFNQHVRALENLGAPVEYWSVPIIDLILTKINSNTSWQWELTLIDNQMPHFQGLLEFIEKRANSVDLCSNVESQSKIKTQKSMNKNNPGHSFSTTSAPATQRTSHKLNCVLCPNLSNHPTYRCSKFKNLAIDARRKLVSDKLLCFNCLHSSHTRDSCKSNLKCYKCKGDHNTLLCLNDVTSEPQIKSTTSFVINSPTSELITTACINVVNNNGLTVQCRALIDTGSSTHFMTERLAKKLGLRSTKTSSVVNVLNAISTVSKGTVIATIQSRQTGYQRELTFLTVDTISSYIPSQPIQRRKINIPKNIPLADPNFERPAPVDILLASGTSLSLFSQGQINLSEPNGPELYLQKTLLGWVIGGSAPSENCPSDVTCHLTTLESSLQKFWEIEEIAPAKQRMNVKTKIEAACEDHFQETVSRTPDGRYSVALPFNERKGELGESRSTALKRLAGIERKLSMNPELKKGYTAVMNEYVTLGHMTPVREGEEEEGGVYLPHHAVTKESQTTAVRVVFDGSAKTSSGVSLNDCLLVGPTIQPDMLTQLIRFRQNPIVVSGDIEKMYRQFLVRPEDRKFQKILWRNAEGQIQTYELNTITFGLGPAPFLAIRCLHQLAEDESKNFPLAAKILRENMYVDNALFGTENLESAIHSRDQLISALKRGGMNIRQWASNEPRVLEGLPPECIDQHLVLGDSKIKMLGVMWNADSDAITYFVHTDQMKNITKRNILAQIAKIFDPLGLLAPVITYAKIILQELWKLKLHWDETLTLSLRETWLKFYSQLPLLNNFSVERKIIVDQPIRIELHGFSDASERAYGACTYIKSVNNKNNVQISLLCAKSRVAPVKTITIPKLELCGARLLTDLVWNVTEQLQIKFDEVFYWTDSTVVLDWLHLYPSSLKVFVANRVAEIQSKTDINKWAHVRTSDNPADLISRGQIPANFLKSSLWQHGPSWLRQPQSEWPVSKFTYEPDRVPELKPIQCFHSNLTDLSLLEKFSSVIKLQTIVAYCLRWKNRQNFVHITVPELHNALKTIIRLVQKSSFPEERRSLEQGKSIDPQSRLLKLTPFLDKEGLIRVGGRLKNATLPFSQRHPILLPKSHHVTNLIIEAEHLKHAHAGNQATLYALRRRFWIIEGRNSVRRILRNCVKCRRLQPLSLEYLMGDLPAPRVTPSRPFTHVGIDFCGPFFLKEKKERNRNKVKAYVSIFVCFVTKAVHLELVTDLSSDSFIAALRRFVSRRGLCSVIHSDNATNFTGANNQLQELRELFKDSQHLAKINSFTTAHNIEWKFIPARSPNFGGLWEAAVKSFKHHIYKVVGLTLFTYEEFYTFCTEIEAILNSRPLSSMSSDPNDLLALTPGHFLIGDSLTSLPDVELRDVPVNRLANWQHLQQLKQNFWARWSKEYLTDLTVRHKWTKDVPNVQQGTLVLLKEDNLPPLKWVMGRVIDCTPGTDGIVRVVTIKTEKSVLKRSVRQIAPLPIESAGDGKTSSQ